jgi:APA family basic amino acid/polyamine antiporter
MSGFVSLVAGFSAPIASASKGFSRYLTHFFPALAEDPKAIGDLGANDLIAVGLVWLLIAIQLRGARSGMRFSDFITSIKVVGVVALILGAAALGHGDATHFFKVSTVYAGLDGPALSTALGTSLIFVMFCYSGWNASAYLAAEFENPQRDLPRSLMLGTALVVLLYLGVNLVYFYGADVEELAGVTEVGLVASRNLFGPTGTSVVTLVLCVSLVASATAMTIAGPRVYYAVGQDYPLFGFLSRTDASRGSPVAALLLQGTVTTLIIVSGSIDQIMQYAGFTLTLFASLAVSCVIVLRFRRPELSRPFRTWGYPATPLLFLSVSAWMMFWSMRGRPLESTLAFLTVLAGGLLFWWVTRRARARPAGGL